MRKARLVVLLTIGISFLTVVTIAEEITLTTYYPAPYGEYEELRANKLGVGSGTDTTVLNDGDLEVSGRLRVKDSKDSWDSLLSGGIIKEKFLPYCPQEITSDVYTNGQSQATGCSFGGYAGYYNISKLTPENVRKDVVFGRGEVGTMSAGYTKVKACTAGFGESQCTNWCTVGTKCESYPCFSQYADANCYSVGLSGSAQPVVYTYDGNNIIRSYMVCWSGTDCTGSYARLYSSDYTTYLGK